LSLAAASSDLTWQLSLAGLCLGVLVGMTGMGGGSLMTPLLILLFGFNPTVAVGTDILHGAISKSFGAVRHRMLGHVHARLTFWMFIASGPMSLLGVWIASGFGDHAKAAQERAIGAALILGGTGFLLKTFVKRGVQPSEAPFLLRNRHRLIAFVLGAAGGFVVGLTSVGSGTFFGLVMLLVFPLTAQRIVGTDLFHAAALLWVAGIGYLAFGNVDLRAIGFLLIGSVPGILIGSQLTVGIADRSLRIAFAAVLVLSGFKLLSPLPSDWTNGVIGVALAVGLVSLAVWTAVWLRDRRRVRSAFFEDARPEEVR
jgi:uncharacterized membrane protein YfcA